MCRDNFKLFTQHPKPKEICIGSLDISTKGEASFFKGERVVVSMERAKVDFAGADGIRLSGFENIGYEKNGTPKFRYQEWWLAYR